WTDVPAINNPPYSRPGWQAWYGLYPPGSYTYSNYQSELDESFYYPSVSNLVLHGDTQIWQYNFGAPQCMTGTTTNPAGFYQSAGSIYWLSVTAYCTNGTFGWKTRVPFQHFNDDATWSTSLLGPHWT